MGTLAEKNPLFSVSHCKVFTKRNLPTEREINEGYIVFPDFREYDAGSLLGQGENISGLSVFLSSSERQCVKT